MFVVPDVVPHLHPTLDLRIAYPGFSRRADDGRKHRLVEPGTFLRPEQVRTCHTWVGHRSLMSYVPVVDNRGPEALQGCVPHGHAAVHAADG